MRAKFEPRHVDGLVRLLLAMRPDWTKGYTTDAVERMRLIDDDLEHVVTAAVRGALSPKIAKPDVLAMQGEHWRGPVAPDQAVDPRSASGFHAAVCHRCGWFHRPDEDCDRPNPPADLAAAAARAREAIRPPRISG